MAEKPELEAYDLDLSAYDEIIFGFPVWAGTFTPPLRTFILENKENLKNKTIAAFACQSGSGAERAFSKLKDCIGTTSFATTAIFIDPKQYDEAVFIEDPNTVIIHEMKSGYTNRCPISDVYYQ